MAEAKEFRRGSAIVAPGFLIHVCSALILINGVDHLLSQQWVWAGLDLVVAISAWLNYAWQMRTPIIRVGPEEIVVLRHQFMRSRRVRLSDIQALDESRPSVARLALTGGRQVAIPLHWLEWDDRLRFLEYLKTLLGTGRA